MRAPPLQNERLAEIQTSLKQITQVRAQISSFSNALKAEFPDESFPLDLEQMVQILTLASTQALESLAALSQVPTLGLKNFCEEILRQEHIDTLFETDPGLEIDQSLETEIQVLLKHVIESLVTHGLKSEPAQVRIELRAEGRTKLNLLVSDDGSGAEPQTRATLTATEGLIQKMQGSIRASNRQGRGTTFQITLPRAFKSAI